MAYCPECKAEWMDGTTECPVCGYELTPEEKTDGLVVIGYVNDQLTADFAKEVLISCEIPVFVHSRSGFFGTMGLTLRPFYKSGAAPFEIMVPQSLVAEAAEILASALGDGWQKKDA